MKESLPMCSWPNGWGERYESRRLTNTCKLISMRSPLKKRVHVLKTDLVSRIREVYLVEVMTEIWRMHKNWIEMTGGESALGRGFSSVQFSRSVVSDSLRPNESQHTRIPCPSPTPRVHSDTSVIPSSHLILCRPFLFLPAIPPSIRVFSKSQLFAWGGQSTGVSALASFLPKNTQGWSPLEWKHMSIQ